MSQAKTKKTTKPKNGRPSSYTQALANKICGLLAEGKSLRSIVRDNDDVPSMQTIFTWLGNNKKFLDQYVRSKEEAADALADDIQDISDRVLTKEYDPAAARVAVDAKKWIASKLKPKRYGDHFPGLGDGTIIPIPMIYVPKELPYDSVVVREVVEAEATTTPSKPVSGPSQENVVPGTAHESESHRETAQPVQVEAS